MGNCDCPRTRDLATYCSSMKGDWLLASPFEWLHQKVNSKQWRVMFCYRFGIPVYNIYNSPCPCCSLPLDIYGSHAVSCAGTFHNSGSCRTSRHNAIRDSLFHFGLEAKLSIQKEKHDLCNTRAKPADIFLPSFRDNSKDLCVDVTVCNSLPFQSSNSIFNPSDSLTLAENQKIQKYLNLGLRNDAKLIPFVLGSLGGFNTFAENLIRDLGKAKALSLNYIESPAYYSSLLKKKLSFIVQKFNADAIILRGVAEHDIMVF